MDRQGGESAGGKVTAYEAVRGCAALAVVIGHCFFGFGRAYLNGYVPDIILRAISNANYAIAFFFVLSGFVLTRRFFADADANYLIFGALKRWPRLALLTTISTLVSCSLRALDLFWYQQAGALVNTSGKEWLSHFAYGDGFGPPYQPDFWNALKQGSFSTFFFGYSSYNSSMWTMQIEFYGSFVAFGLAYLLGRNLLLAVLVSFVAVPLLLWWSAYMMCFVGGVALAYLIARIKPRWPIALSVPLLIVGLLLPSTELVRYFIGPKGSMSATALYMACSLLAITAIATSSRLQILMSGKVAAFLGRISFPLYLIHILVLTSLGCWLYVTVAQPYSAAAATIATISVSIILAAILAPVDSMWVHWLNGLAKRAPALTQQAASRPSVPPNSIAVAPLSYGTGAEILGSGGATQHPPRQTDQAVSRLSTCPTSLRFPDSEPP